LVVALVRLFDHLETLLAVAFADRPRIVGVEVTLVRLVNDQGDLLFGECVTAARAGEEIVSAAHRLDILPRRKGVHQGALV